MIGIVLLGESNSGKSTIANGILNKKDYRYISSGDIARRISDKELLDSGQLAPEQLMRKHILTEINDDNKTFILDGCPRFYEQYEWLNQSVLCDLIYIYIDVPYEQIKNRAKLRGRSDDNSLDIKHEFWETNTMPMIREMIKCGETVYTFNNNDGDNICKIVNNIIDILEEIEC